MPLPKENEVFTYVMYKTWPDEERWELIDGVAWCMSPAPSRVHQQMLGELLRQFANFLTDVECEVFVAPFVVKLSSEAEDDTPTVVQPDMVVCCDREKLTDQGMSGAPDLVLEIVSPASGIRYRKDKFVVYERFGVGEYWIVDPEERVLEVYHHTGKKLERFGAYGPEDRPAAAALHGFEADLKRVFRKES